MRAPLDEIEPLVLAMPEMFTESGLVSTFTYDEDTYCYGFFCNYYNQAEQHELSRGGAKELLGLCSNLLGEGFAEFPLPHPPLKYNVHVDISCCLQFAVTHENASDDTKNRDPNLTPWIFGNF